MYVSKAMRFPRLVRERQGLVVDALAVCAPEPYGEDGYGMMGDV